MPSRMFKRLNVYSGDVREDGTIPQYCEDGPCITTFYMPCCDGLFNFKHKYFALSGYMYGSYVETRIPLDVMKTWVDCMEGPLFEYNFKTGKLKEYYHMWE